MFFKKKKKEKEKLKTILKQDYTYDQFNSLEDLGITPEGYDDGSLGEPDSSIRIEDMTDERK